MELAFVDAINKVRLGDNQPLADYIRNHCLEDQFSRECIAQILEGKIKKVDGRIIKPSTKRMLEIYRIWLQVRKELSAFEKDTVEKIMPMSALYAQLATKFSMDADSVERTIKRAKAAKKEEG